MKILNFFSIERRAPDQSLSQQGNSLD